MIRIIDQTESGDLLARLEARSVAFDPDLMKAVGSIIDDVRRRGDEALIEYTARFDGVELTPEQLRVDEQTLHRSAERVDKTVLVALREAISNVRMFHQNQVERS